MDLHYSSLKAHLLLLVGYLARLEEMSRRGLHIEAPDMGFANPFGETEEMTMHL